MTTYVDEDWQNHHYGGMSSALHYSQNTGDGGSNHLVAIGDLRVLIIQDGADEWYAQGLEVDYLAQGKSLEDVQKSFERGLKATVRMHIEKYGHILGVLKQASDDSWAEFYKHATSDEFKFTQISVHEFDVESDEVLLTATTEPPESGLMMGITAVEAKSLPAAAEPVAAAPVTTTKKKKLPFKQIKYLGACASA